MRTNVLDESTLFLVHRLSHHASGYTFCRPVYGDPRNSGSREVAGLASERDDEAWSTFHLTRYYVLAGNRTEALGHLKCSFDIGYWDGAILDDPDLASLRGDPEFEALLETRTGRSGVAGVKH